MSRLRKASRVWRDDGALDDAARAMLSQNVDYFTIEPEAIFARRAPLEIEIGAGRGDFMLEYASANPDKNFLAIELSGTVGQLLAMRCGRAELPNVKVAKMDARTLVNLMLPDCSVAAFHIYYPDPWPKERHIKHRMVSPIFVRNLARSLCDNGNVYAASDVKQWAEEIFAMLDAGDFRRIDREPPGAKRSAFGRKYMAQGKPVYFASFEKIGEKTSAKSSPA
jgi:tRNA (guanine-N(7)-)-methyltransferase